MKCYLFPPCFCFLFAFFCQSVKLGSNNFHDSWRRAIYSAVKSRACICKLQCTFLQLCSCSTDYCRYYAQSSFLQLLLYKFLTSDYIHSVVNEQRVHICTSYIFMSFFWYNFDVEICYCLWYYGSSKGWISPFMRYMY